MTVVAPPNGAAPRAGVAGRPRDARIDDAVLRATTELLVEVGYLRLTVGAIAERAGTNKPAVYRRWPTKAHLVHAAVFPLATLPPPGGGEAMAVGGDLRHDIRALVVMGVALLGHPAARAALPGLMAEMTADPSLLTDVLGRFDTGPWGWLEQRIGDAITAGTVRPDVAPTTVLELIAGATFVATAVRRRAELDEQWVEGVVDLIARGIAP